eukprot:TRINITY_DN225_c0_g1_i1.p1 TRINITY_DN225_c0_g1~~TRINITY_DN225_c0_g1_i1.p1  ORF type:complete len:352 (-),score=72.51 TRINITY_DN225_c0_g1_i1:2-1057(-)
MKSSSKTNDGDVTYWTAPVLSGSDRGDTDHIEKRQPSTIELMSVNSGNPLNKKYCINPSEVQKRHVIGQGSFGKVYLALFRGAQCAMKMCSAETIKDLQNEAEALLGVTPHPNVICFYGFCDDPGNTFMLMQYFPGGSLDEVLERSPDISYDTKIRILHQAACGLFHLHQQNPPVIHRDIACRNILVTADLKQAVVCDFGMSRNLNSQDDHKYTMVNAGPVRWMAPESLAHQEYSRKSDVWMFAVTIWECLNGEPPYKEKGLTQVVIYVMAGNIPRISESWNPELKELLKKCWLRDSKKRPEMLEVMCSLGSMFGEEEPFRVLRDDSSRLNKKKKYRLRGRSSETAKAHRG